MVNPVSMRFPLNLQGKAHDDVVEAIQYHDDAITDLQAAIPALKGQIGTAAPASSAATTTNVTQASEEIIQAPQNSGFVNNQTGVTAYTTLQSDSGNLILLNDASAIAVTLSTSLVAPGVQLPWSTTFLNLGAGTATLTPASGTISYAGNFGAASMPVASGAKVRVWYDGTNFYAG